MKMTCKKCKSENIEEVKYRGTTCIVCKDCGFDERDELEVFDEGKSNQKEKGRYSPYKAGGGKRS